MALRFNALYSTAIGVSVASLFKHKNIVESQSCGLLDCSPECEVELPASQAPEEVDA